MHLILDGQQRLEVAKRSGVTHVLIDDRDDIAAKDVGLIISRLNTDRKNLTPFELFQARLSSKTKDTVDITRANKRAGVYFSAYDDGPNSIRAVRAVEEVYAWGGAGLLTRMYLILNRTWGGDVDRFQGTMIKGMAHLLHTRPNIDDGELVMSLLETSPKTLIRTARGLEGHSGAHKAMSTVLAYYYEGEPVAVKAA